MREYRANYFKEEKVSIGREEITSDREYIYGETKDQAFYNFLYYAFGNRFETNSDYSLTFRYDSVLDEYHISYCNKYTKINYTVNFKEVK